MVGAGVGGRRAVIRRCGRRGQWGPPMGGGCVQYRGRRDGGWCEDGLRRGVLMGRREHLGRKGEERDGWVWVRLYCHVSGWGKKGIKK